MPPSPKSLAHETVLCAAAAEPFPGGCRFWPFPTSSEPAGGLRSQDEGLQAQAGEHVLEVCRAWVSCPAPRCLALSSSAQRAEGLLRVPCGVAALSVPCFETLETSRIFPSPSGQCGRRGGSQQTAPAMDGRGAREGTSPVCPSARAGRDCGQWTPCPPRGTGPPECGHEA